MIVIDATELRQCLDLIIKHSEFEKNKVTGYPSYKE